MPPLSPLYDAFMLRLYACFAAITPDYDFYDMIPLMFRRRQLYADTPVAFHLTLRLSISMPPDASSRAAIAAYCRRRYATTDAAEATFARLLAGTPDAYASAMRCACAERCRARA